MEKHRLRLDFCWWSLLLLLSLLHQNLDFCFSLNDEGWTLLRFKERVEIDPYAALSDWNEGAGDPCDWFGVECENGGVVALNLEDLCIKGILSPELAKLIHLKSLILYNNSFCGVIPKEFGELHNLEVLNLGHNNLSGPLPSNLGNILSLEVLVLRNNQFLGSIPSELYELNMLSELEFESNVMQLNGRSIARKLGNATIRRVLQQPKPGNQTTQPSIPDESPNERNRSVGAPVDSPAKSRKPPMGGDSSQASSPNTPSPNSPPSHNDNTGPPPSLLTPDPTPSGSPSLKKSQIKDTLLYASIGVGVFSLFAFIVICVLCFRGNKVVTVRPWTTGLSGQLQKAFITGVPSLKRSELETACEDFSNIIGSLSDCTLYKGTLSSGVEIAVTSTLVTSTKDWSKHSEAQFRKKIATLSKVNHKNFVNLLGYCEEEEPFSRMMVFEYAPNGTLFEHLHIKEAEHLDWPARLRIAMGIAYCLDHMHQLNPSAILINLQSTSVYLTDDFAAKISDLEFWSETTVAGTGTSSSGPLDAHMPNPESIVYKFGILLLEIISGRLPYFEKSDLLLDWASDYLSGSRPLKDMVDRTLKSFCEEDVVAMCEVIRRCCNPEPQARPSMKEVVDQLRKITAVPPDGATPKISPLWWAELEILSTEAN